MAFQRLTALDASFLDLEGPSTPMHLAATLIFDRSALVGPDGAVDMDLVRRVVTARLDQTPRLRMRLASTRLTGHPVWVDDVHFQLDYHLRYMALPPPATREILRELVGQVLSSPLDRGKPLWEIWVVDGLEGGRLAAICKMHHALMDGMAGVGAMSVLLAPAPSSQVPEAGSWSPEAPPSPESLLLADVWRRASGARALLGTAGRALRDPLGTAAEVRRSAEAVAHALLEGLSPASPTPLNRPIGPHRTVRWLRVDLDALKEVKRSLGGTINDVVVATVAGAMRRFLEGRSLDVNGLNCRGMFPVDVRTRKDDGTSGNRLAVIGGYLPVNVSSARRRYEAVRETTSEIKNSGLAWGTEIINALGEWIHGAFTTQGQRLPLVTRAYNVIITNVRGPQIPLYMLEAPMLEVYPTLPLFQNQALSVAVFSYAGAMYWGLTADRRLVPDLGDFADAVATEVAELKKAAA